MTCTVGLPGYYDRDINRDIFFLIKLCITKDEKVPLLEEMVITTIPTKITLVNMYITKRGDLATIGANHHCFMM